MDATRSPPAAREGRPGAARRRIGPLALLCAVLVGPGAQAFAFQVTLEAVSRYALENPHDVKLSPSGEHLFVSDVGNNQVVVLDASSLEFVAAFGADHQRGTHDVDFDASGKLYVADTHRHRVGIYAMDGPVGTLVGELSAGLSKPEGVLVHPNGRVYATGAGSNNVVVYEQGRMVAEAGGLSAPHDVEAAPGGDIWIADAGNDRLVRMTADLRVVGVLAGEEYGFSGPRYLDALADGTLVVADKYAHAVKVVSPEGRLVAVVREAGPGADPPRLSTPEGIETAEGTLWVADSGNDRVLRFRVTAD